MASLGVVSRLSGFHLQCPVEWHCQASMMSAVMFFVYSVWVVWVVCEIDMCSACRLFLGLFAVRKSRMSKRQTECTEIVCRSACDE